MNFHKIKIQRFIILYIITFGLLGSILMLCFSYFFGLSVIQKNYSEDYVEATFDSFDSGISLLASRINMLIFTVSSDSELLNGLYADVDKQPNDEINQLLTDLINGYDEIVQLDIISPNGKHYTGLPDTSTRQSALSLPTDSFLDSLTTQKLHLYDRSLLDESGEPVLVIGRKTIPGQLLVYIRESTVSSLYDSHFLNNSTIFLSNNGKVISCSDVDFIGINKDLLLKSQEAGTSRRTHIVYSKVLDIPALKSNPELTYLLSVQDFRQTSYTLIRVLIALLFLTVFLCILLTFSVSRKLFHHMNRLRNNLDTFATDYNHTFSLSRESEIEELDRQFVQMADKLRALFYSLEKEKDLKRIAELKALQSQINPHFIYNSIDAIGWMAKLKRPYEDIEMLSYHLGLFFRLGLHKGDNEITVAEELQHMRSYLEIEKFRYPDSFTITEEIIPEILPCKIIKIILQPLVENAISHGFSNIDYMGHVTIRISLLPSNEDRPEYFLFEVIDNGIGFTPSKGQLPHSTRENGGYGLRNVNERLTLEYGEEAALHFDSSPGCGTTVSFRIRRDMLQ